MFFCLGEGNLKRFLLLSLLILPISAHADLSTVNDHESKMVHQLVQHSYNVGSGGIFEGTVDIKNLEQVIKQYDSEFVERVKDEDDQSKRVLYRSRMAKETFDFLKDYFVNQIEQASKTENRELLIEEYDDADYLSKEYKLDDSDFLYDCGYPPSQQGIESAKYCYYKEGHTIFSIRHFIEEDGDENLVVNKENIADNTSIYYWFNLNANQADIARKYGTFLYVLSMNVIDQPYDEMFAQRNQIVADELAGMTELVGKFCNSDDMCNTVYTVRDPKKWKSSKIPPFIGKTANGFVSYSKN